MYASARPPRDADPEPLTPEREAAVKAASGWVQQLARTLKNRRLYERNNPTVARFRQELHAALVRLIDEHGPLVLHFTADDVTSEGVSLYPARSRDDNLALAFHRDGIRSLRFNAGVEAGEIDTLVEAVIQVTGQSSGVDDLVTLLWEAHLRHVELDYVPGEADTGGGLPAEGVESVPWPTPGAAAEPERETAPTATEETDSSSRGGRSDDWSLGEATIEIEAGFEELQALAPSEVERFRREFEADRAIALVTGSIEMSNAFLAAGAGPEDRLDLARFLPRVLRQAVAQGAWNEARRALDLLARCEVSEWSVETFAQELLQPISIAGIKEHLEAQEPATAAEFLALARALGDQAVDLVNLVLLELQNSRHQRAFSEAVIDLCRENPERLAPWLADRRWFVVRSVVQMLAAIGGDSITGMLQSVARHPEPRVRLEVVSALRRIDPKLARPILLQLLEDSDARMFCAVLPALAQTRDPATARHLLEIMLDPTFEGRSADEKRAVYSALAGAGGDELLPDLELELHKGNWFSRGNESHRQAMARCIARIGTPAARAMLEEGARSRRGPVRKVCEEALARMNSHE